MAIPLIGGLLGAVGDIAGSWVKGKVEEKKALTSIKVARAKAEATVYEKQATGELDMEKSLTDKGGMGMIGAVKKQPQVKKDKPKTDS